MRVCVDTTVLIDILKDEFRRYQELLYSAISSKETLVAPAVVFAELMPHFNANTNQIETFLMAHKVRIEPLDLQSVSVASKRWIKYLKRKTKAKCPKCGHTSASKEHFLSDFYIGGFALARCDALLTRDRRIYKKYFHDLKRYETIAKANDA